MRPHGCTLPSSIREACHSIWTGKGRCGSVDGRIRRGKSHDRRTQPGDTDDFQSLRCGADLELTGSAIFRLKGRLRATVIGGCLMTAASVPGSARNRRGRGPFGYGRAGVDSLAERLRTAAPGAHVNCGEERDAAQLAANRHRSGDFTVFTRRCRSSLHKRQHPFTRPRADGGDSRPTERSRAAQSERRRRLCQMVGCPEAYPTESESKYAALSCSTERWVS